MNVTAKTLATDLVLCATPYDPDAPFFYFSTLEEYESKAAALTNCYGQPVEEFMVDLIDGDRLDCELAKAVKLDQCNFASFLEAAEEWNEHEKTVALIALNHIGGLTLDDDPHRREVAIFRVESLSELAEQFVGEGLYGEIPDRLSGYINYEAIGRDLRFDHHEITIAGETFFYSMN